MGRDRQGHRRTRARREVDGRTVIDQAGKRTRYKLTNSVDLVDESPRNPSGQILKREQRNPYWENEGRSVG